MREFEDPEEEGFGSRTISDPDWIPRLRRKGNR